MKGEGPLGNLLEMGKEMVCAEGLLRREIKVVPRLCIPCSERPSLPASKNSLPGGKVSSGLGDGEMSLLLLAAQVLCESNAVLQHIDGAQQGGQEGAPTASCVQPGLLCPRDLPVLRSFFS